jgi:hypothetical protein
MGGRDGSPSRPPVCRIWHKYKVAVDGDRKRCGVSVPARGAHGPPRSAVKARVNTVPSWEGCPTYDAEASERRRKGGVDSDRKRP